MAANVIVVGSANMDYIVRVVEVPQPGETVLARGFEKQPGGKGGNQAVAAAKLGATVGFVGAIGDDGDGRVAMQSLRDAGVNTTEVAIVPDSATGIALISVADSGENSIVVVAGANHALRADTIAPAVDRLAASGDGAIVVVQAEVPVDAIAAAVRAGAARGDRVILNLAPFCDLPNDLLRSVDPLVVNESEASRLIGEPVTDPHSALRAAKVLAELTASVVITLGSAGAVWAVGDDAHHVPACDVASVVDTTGAGDAFVGAVAAFLARGSDLATAVDAGTRAGAFAVSGHGAQGSYPTLADL